MQLTSLLSVLAVFGTALAAVPNERAPFTGSVIAARTEPESYCDPTRRANANQQKFIFEKFKNKMFVPPSFPLTWLSYHHTTIPSLTSSQVRRQEGHRRLQQARPQGPHRARPI